MDDDYASMTDQELGFYHRCLNRSWMNDGLPADLDELARIFKQTRTYIDKLWKRVGRKFILRVGTARVFNPRQEDERSEAISKSVNATKSVRTRYERKTDDQLPALARAVSDSVSDSVVVDTLTTETKPLSRAKVFENLQESWFETEFWPEYWLKKGKKSALGAFKNHATTEERKGLIVKAMLMQRPEMLTREPRHRKMAQGWLNGEQFEDEPDSTAPYLIHRPPTKTDRAVEILLDNLELERKL